MATFFSVHHSGHPDDDDNCKK